MSVKDTEDAAVLDGRKLDINAWNFEKEKKLALSLENDLAGWQIQKCTVMVKGIDIDRYLAEQAVRDAAGSDHVSQKHEKFILDGEANTPVTSKDWFASERNCGEIRWSSALPGASTYRPADGLWHDADWEWRATGLGDGNLPEGHTGAGYYRLGALAALGAQGGMSGKIAAKAVGVAGNVAAATAKGAAGVAKGAAGVAVGVGKGVVAGGGGLVRGMSRAVGGGGGGGGESETDGLVGEEMSAKSGVEGGHADDNIDSRFLSHIFSPYGLFLAATVRVRGTNQETGKHGT